MKLEELTKDQLYNLVVVITDRMTSVKNMLAIEHPAQNVLAYDLDNIQEWEIAPKGGAL